MKLHELKAIIPTRKSPLKMKIDVPSDNYAWEDCCCLINEGGRWSVFYFDRGERIRERSFLSEDAAIEEFTSLSKEAGVW